MHRVEDPDTSLPRGLEDLHHMRNALIPFSDTFYAILYFTACGNEIVIRVDDYQSGDVIFACQLRHFASKFELAEGERKSLDTWIEEFNLKGSVLDRPLLPDELIHPGYLNLTRAIGGGIGSMIVPGCGAVYLYSETHRLPILRRA